MIPHASSVGPVIILAVLFVGAVGMMAAVELFCSVCYSKPRPVVEESEIIKRIIR
ncbi:MAG: hypothetical protein HY226_03695 [Candidatus Vogelbacteria bacterium]|nr:hypothetical protein [Candidatus Vogelbacteria bacterium]